MTRNLTLDTQTLIIGGGLTGLSLAAQLARQGQDFALVEARERVGGRILTHHQGRASFDLGPAWFWPGQPRIAAQIARLGLTVFEQHYAGELTYEDEQGRVSRGRGFSSMQGSLRLRGGLGALTDALAARIDPDRIHLSTPIQTIKRSDGGVIAISQNGQTYQTRQAVLALPPRIATRFSFTPALPDAAVQAMTDIPTWMAGQAKALAVYETPFWRNDGLSGDAMSRRGPMVEIHDASPAEGGLYALFGFIGVPAQARTDLQHLRQSITAQLTRLFGAKAAQPLDLIIKDWAADPFTATEEDQRPLFNHPSYGLPRALDRVWDDRLIFAGTELAPQFGGYLEGALESANHVSDQLLHQKVG